MSVKVIAHELRQQYTPTSVKRDKASKKDEQTICASAATIYNEARNLIALDELHS